MAEQSKTSAHGVRDRLEELAAKLFGELSSKEKVANIIVVGKPGVGKSTLINTVFRENIAATGVGRPMTQGIVEVKKAGVPICILDSQGLELAEFSRLRDALLNEIATRQGEEAERYIHLAWICISAEGKRIEDGEINLAKSLKDAGVDVIVVLTKTVNFKDDEFKAVVEREFRGICKEVHATRSLSEDIRDDDDQVIGRREVKGIDELISSSYRYIPESQRRSFANALSLKHKKSIVVKRDEATNVINIVATLAGTAAAVPIPFSDALTLIPIQIGMILKISHIFGMSVDKTAILPVISALVGSAGAAVIGRTVFAAVLKFIPGLGSVAGGVISASIATGLTRQMGMMYLDVLTALAEEGRPLLLDEALAVLKQKLGLSSVAG